MLIAKTYFKKVSSSPFRLCHTQCFPTLFSDFLPLKPKDPYYNVSMDPDIMRSSNFNLEEYFEEQQQGSKRSTQRLPQKRARVNPELEDLINTGGIKVFKLQDAAPPHLISDSLFLLDSHNRSYKIEKMEKESIVKGLPTTSHLSLETITKLIEQGAIRTVNRGQINSFIH